LLVFWRMRSRSSSSVFGHSVVFMGSSPWSG
jgi:hypothetical protein